MPIDMTAMVSGVLGALLGAGGVTPLVVAVMKARRDQATDTNRFAAATFTRMERRIAALEESEKECVEAKEQLLVELGSVRAELRGVSARVEHLQQELNYERDKRTGDAG